eukprot:tig00000042_g15468.t1
MSGDLEADAAAAKQRMQKLQAECASDGVGWTFSLAFLGISTPICLLKKTKLPLLAAAVTGPLMDYAVRWEECGELVKRGLYTPKPPAKSDRDIIQEHLARHKEEKERRERGAGGPSS